MERLFLELIDSKLCSEDEEVMLISRSQPETQKFENRSEESAKVMNSPDLSVVMILNVEAELCSKKNARSMPGKMRAV